LPGWHNENSTVPDFKAIRSLIPLKV